MDYDLELNKVVSQIEKNHFKKVCIQLPDGLKNKALQIKDKLEEKTKAEIYIWFGSNFGACDIPLQLEKLDFDLIINFGHSKI